MKNFPSKYRTIGGCTIGGALLGWVDYHVYLFELQSQTKFAYRSSNLIIIAIASASEFELIEECVHASSVHASSDSN